jgi:Protein of unknown function (DUF3293)
MDPGRESLDAAYRATVYTAETPAGPVALRIGESNADLDRLLDARGVSSWAYVTAHNPGSRSAPSLENEACQRELRAAVAKTGFVFYEGAGVGHGWPPEPSLLVLGISESDASALGRRFGQNAIVFGELGEPARLVWLHPAGADGDTTSRV